MISQFFMKHHDDKQLTKELEWDMTDDEDSIDIGGEGFDTEVEWRKDVELNPNDEILPGV